MEPVEDEGIITRRFPYSESSYILTWLTAGHGLVRTLAKGAARPKQALFGKIDLFHQGHVSWVPSRKSSLHTLRELSVENFHRNLTRSYLGLLAASYFFEIIELVAESQTPVPEMYSLYIKALDYLEIKDCTPALVERFERRLLETLGLNHPDWQIGQLRRHAYPQQPKTLEKLQAELKKAESRSPGSLT